MLVKLPILYYKKPNDKNSINDLTVVVEQENLDVKIQASGTVEPIKSVNISPKNPGILVQLLVEQGDIVKQGQVLGVMENAEIQAQVIQSQANYNRAIASLEEAKIRIPAEINQSKVRVAQAIARLDEIQERIPKDINQARARVVEAQSRLELSETRVERYEFLENEGAATTDSFG